MKKIGLLYCGIFLLLRAFGQDAEGTIRGSIKTEQGGGMLNAVFALYRAKDTVFIKGTLSSADGSFVMERVANGEYLGKVTFTGYQAQWVPVSVSGPSTMVDAVTLKPDGKQLQTVIVSGRRPVVDQRIDATILTITDLVRKEAPNSFEILRFAPKVYLSDNEDNILMAGKDLIQVMINGKVQRMTGRDLVKLLKSIPSSQVEQVDLMSNPSSKYDVQGNTGIINIRLKRSVQSGFVDNINLSHSQSTHSLGDLSNSLNYGNGNVYATTYIAYHYGHYLTRYDENALITDAGAPYSQLSKNLHLDKWSDPVFKGGLDWAINRRNSIGIMAETEKSTNTASYYTVTGIGQPGKTPDSTITTNSHEPNSRRWNTYNLNYRYADTSGSELTFDIDRSYYKKTDDNQLTNTIGKPAGEYTGQTNDFKINTQIDLLTFKTDYTKNWRSQVKLEAGAKVSFVRTINDQTTEYMEGAKMLIDTSLTNTFNYNEHVQSAYLNIGKNFKKFGFQIGGRYELTQSKGVSTDLFGGRINQPDTNYGNFLPSAYINYRPTKRSAFRLSYVQRIKRPSYENLQPFDYQIDLFHYHLGNPLLRPQKNANFELDYTYKNTLSVAAMYVYTTDYFSTIQYQQQGIFYEGLQNTGQSRVFTLNVSYPFVFYKWWSSENKVSAFNNYFKGPLLAGYLNEGKWSYSLYTSQRFVLPGETILRINARYTAPQLRLYYSDASSGSVSASIGRQIIQKKGILRIGVSDIFLTQRQLTTVHFGSLNYVQNNTWESRTLFMEFSLRFGSTKMSQPREHQVGNAEEKSRTK